MNCDMDALLNNVHMLKGYALHKVDLARGTSYNGINTVCLAYYICSESH